MAGRGTIVACVDGSADARRALDRAIGEARRRHDAVLAVHAWTTGQAVDFTGVPVVVPARLIKQGPRVEPPSDFAAYSPAFSG